jgi:hypothetical protein
LGFESGQRFRDPSIRAGPLRESAVTPARSASTSA